MAKLPSGQYKWQLSSRDLSTFTPYSEAVEMTLLGADGARESNRNVGLFFFFDAIFENHNNNDYDLL